MSLSKKIGATVWATIIAGLGMFLTISSAQALDEAVQLKLGENEYLSSCASCHGVNAKGAGPVAKVLTTKPADLTLITKKFNGQFPAERIYKVIDGRDFYMIDPHGDTQMPVWGYRYMSEVDKRASEVPHDLNTQAIVFGRIMSLVGYLESIQAK